METRDPQDTFIRNLIIVAGVGVALGLFTVAMVITVMVSANFNILNWME